VGAIGHRVVHGGEKITSSTLVDDEVLAIIDEYGKFAPLHNPPEAEAIRACREVFGEGTPNVAVFDTAFHQTMPPKAYIYPLPYEYYEKQGIRRYGFHGTSHRYVSGRYFELFGGRENSRIITCHLGNGSSLSAVLNGESVDTSMGFTPLDGFIMGTRSGALDPSIVTYLMQSEGMSPAEMDSLLNKRSGFMGISGVSSDCRDLHAAAEDGSARAALALELLVYGIKKYIGAYAAAMGGLDALIFTGGIGENDEQVRFEICSDMQFLGLEVDEGLCAEASRKEAVFSSESSRVRAMVLPTNEEIMIARDALEIVSR
ncbi:MAG: acetate kinase, partial [Oscillospiraceae bacterium]|nr:acetate kinase [Oscillospiraceae bacterium]